MLDENSRAGKIFEFFEPEIHTHTVEKGKAKIDENGNGVSCSRTYKKKNNHKIHNPCVEKSHTYKILIF